MRPTIKASPVKSKVPAKAPATMEKVLEACVGAIRPTLGNCHCSGNALRNQLNRFFKLMGPASMVREGESYLPAAVCTRTGELANAKALMEHARSFAAQAIEQNRQLNFRFSYRSDAKEVIYHGLAQPIVTAAAVAALLVLRNSVFASAEVSSFSVMGNIGRMASGQLRTGQSCMARKNRSSINCWISPPILEPHALESFLPGIRGSRR